MNYQEEANELIEYKLLIENRQNLGGYNYISDQMRDLNAKVLIAETNLDCSSKEITSSDSTIDKNSN